MAGDKAIHLRSLVPTAWATPAPKPQPPSIPHVLPLLTTPRPPVPTYSPSPSPSPSLPLISVSLAQAYPRSLCDISAVALNAYHSATPRRPQSNLPFTHATTTRRATNFAFTLTLGAYNRIATGPADCCDTPPTTAALSGICEGEHEEGDAIMAVLTPRNGAPRLAARSQVEIPALQHTQTPPRSRRKRRMTPALSAFSPLLLILAVASFLPLASAVFVNFEDCLTRVFLADGKQTPYLRFTPKYVWADFSPDYRLNVTVYGNVSGQAQTGDYPPPDDENWTMPNATFGKIVNLDKQANMFSTLFWNNKVLTYSAWNAPPAPFCQSVLNRNCPVGPAFDGNASEYWTMPAVSVAHTFTSSYAFATWASTLRIVSGNENAQALGCMSTNITPDLGKKLTDAVCYLPAAVLALVAIATIFAATCSPWGTSNIFRWTSNYGRDEDLLRLVTPGFGDCLQYIQFIVLAGSLSLNYPGFFQPVVSQASWSVLLFNHSFVSYGDGAQSLVDGIYFANGTYGLTRLGQYVGMTKERDIWACMAIFLLVLIACVVLLTQLGFFIRWLSRWLSNTQDGDLTGKNWAFTAGNIIRVIYNYFMLPIIALSLFQLVVGPRSPASVVATAVITLILVAGVATWIFWFIFTTRPRAHLFDDLPTVLTYGPLYNTYSDDAAPFAFIPVLLTIMRGIAIGAIQPSGIAQIIILAICEVILILTLHAFRPFQSNTSMNAYHTFFSTVRLTCVLLSVAFVPSLDVDEAPKGWIGYIILLLHAIVLVFGFFLNSLQTIIEVSARLGGVGADQRGGLTTVFGKRQLSKRNVSRQTRNSLNSNAAMLAHDENKNIQLMDSRSRSMSASSAVLLNGPYDRDSQRASVGFDGFSQDNYGNTSPSGPGANAVPFTFLGGGSSGQSSRRPTLGTMDAGDYYRPPRPRKHTIDSLSNGPGKGLSGSADIADAPYSDNLEIEAIKAGEGPSRSSGTPAPAYLRVNRDDSDPNLDRRNNTDYSVRESDFYYGLRGPALSSQPTRKLKTGPADPMSPVSSATGWFKSLNLLGGRKKEKSKGFEVVRSTRMPPQMMAVEEDAESPEVAQEPYRDSPDSPPRPRNVSGGSGVASAAALAGERRRSSDSESDMSDSDRGYDPEHRISPIAPSLGPIESFGGIDMPSRIGSRASRVTQTRGPPSRVPSIPRKNSRRTKSTETAILPDRLSTVMDVSTPASPMFQSSRQSQHLQPHGPGGMPIRLPFGSTEPSPERSPGHSAASSMYRTDGISDFNAPYSEPRPIGGTAERPLSTGYVQHHMTKDSLQSDGYDAGSHLEASAEIVDRSRSGSTQRTTQEVVPCFPLAPSTSRAGPTPTVGIFHRNATLLLYRCRSRRKVAACCREPADLAYRTTPTRPVSQSPRQEPVSLPPDTYEMPPNANMHPQPSRAYTRPMHASSSQFGGANRSTEGAQEAQAVTGSNASHHAQGVVASHFLAQDRETWMDFLREDGSETSGNQQPRPSLLNPAPVSEARPNPSSSRYTLPNRPSPRTDSSSSRSSDRKRRLTTADSPMRRPSSIRMHSEHMGSTISDPIVLDSPPASVRALPPTPPITAQANTASARRQSDIVLPPWQPDNDVTQCPVCKRPFTFLLRRHHCRKCGRVVCASCSPHRITIPRQFIVHPPSEGGSNYIDLTGDDENAMSPFGPYRNPALGGGEEVRVCNPCVPDPNFNPPPQYDPTSRASRYPDSIHSSSRLPYGQPPPPHPRAHRSDSSAHDASRMAGQGQTQGPRDPLNDNNQNRRMSYHGSSNIGERRLPPFPSAAAQQQQQHPHHRAPLIAETMTNNRSRTAQGPSGFGYGSFTGSSPFGTFGRTAPVPPPLLPQHAQPARPRRQVAEEDECPVCGEELPPNAPGDDELARTRHIEECIALHSSSPGTPAAAPTQQSSASLPTQRTRGMSSAGNGEGASSQSRMSHAARGMLLYIATEKDCTDDEGRQTECTICLEDFEAGDKMARLVCWCKFHEKCIKEWWDKKGRGACPTHQLQE
ncbi:hypothetical protein BDW02DRAFT_583004 [Decorospora gaudefroyi]|uniref:FYVE-domain-containing protein n=1 Tax=Decorospora gaudefroyi TaxID=184978 RepID=A0A6A5K0P9_9PLEO|nr:hypothetical protein BDW02DRAFT_583004 [Decorospora gaudefroyi]